MNGREIPGFYYDREKKKYFQIQKAHTALNPQSKHVLQNVRQEKKQEEALKNAARGAAKRRKETIGRRYLRDSLVHARLDREIGSRRSSYYVKELWPNACASRLLQRPQDGVLLPPSKASPLRYFDRDVSNKTTYATQGSNRIIRIRDQKSSVPSETLRASDDESSSENGEQLPVMRREEKSSVELLGKLTSYISSLTYMPASGALAATSNGSDRPPVVYLSHPERDGAFVHQIFTPKGIATIADAAARPVSHTPISNSVAAVDTENLAVAAAKSLLLFTCTPAGVWDFTTVLQTKSDILTVDWLSPTVISLGQRDGKIRLYDTRSQGSSHILTHPGVVRKIRRADDPTRIVAAGLQDTLFLYDIRSPRYSGTTMDAGNQHYNQHYFAARDTGYYHGRKRQKLMQGALQWSQPVLSFQYRNTNELFLGVDVHPGLGLVAAAHDFFDSSTAISLHNLWTGKLVKEIPFWRDSRQSTDYNICCLKLDVDQETNEPALWTNWEGDIARFRW